MIEPAVDGASERLFIGARSHAHWLPAPVPKELLHALYNLVKHGPTSMNCQPMRLVFAQSQEARERLASCVYEGNVAKVRGAPVVAVVGHDLAFPQHLATLFPHKKDALAYYEGKPDLVARTALRNGSLQGGYLIMAARLMGLDCGPLSGFDSAAVDAECWSGTTIETNFLCCLGYGDKSQLKPSNLRLAFNEVCRIV